MIPESEIGKAIRSIRKSKQLTLDVLAEKSGFTKGYLSRVENSDKAPPISTLLDIAAALGVGISDIFGESQGAPTMTLVRKGERPVVAHDGTQFGYSYEALVRDYPGKHMHPYVLTIPKDIGQTPMFEHVGEEMFMVLKGRVRFLHGNNECLLEEGDCIYFDGSIPHRGFPEGCDQATCLMVLYRPDLN